MARTVADLALFLDTMAGLDLHDPMTFDAPHVSFSDAVARPVAPKRVAFTADYNGKMAIDREFREICTKAARRFEELGCIVEEASPDIGAIDEAFLNLRSQAFVVDRELQLKEHRDKLKPDIVWNTERGLNQTPSALAWAERERAALFRRMVEFFQKYDLLVTPGAPTAAFDVNLRHPETIGGKKPENYMAGSTVNSVITMTTCPAIAVPCGFDQYGRPVGLQLVGKPRGEAALLQAASLYERLARPRSASCPSTPSREPCHPLDERSIRYTLWHVYLGGRPCRFRNGATALPSVCPRPWSKRLKLKEGDEVEVHVAGERDVRHRARPYGANGRSSASRPFARHLPVDWKFDREEANAR